MLEMDAELEQYILAHSEPESEVLAELSRATHLHVLRPRMLSGNLPRAVFENDMPDDWRSSGAGDRDLHGVCRYFNGCRIGGGGSAAHD